MELFHYFSHYQREKMRKKQLSYLFTPRSRDLLEKLTVNFAASQEIPRNSYSG
jgi:hypothetical protein